MADTGRERWGGETALVSARVLLVVVVAAAPLSHHETTKGAIVAVRAASSWYQSSWSDGTDAAVGTMGSTHGSRLVCLVISQTIPTLPPHMVRVQRVNDKDDDDDDDDENEEEEEEEEETTTTTTTTVMATFSSSGSFLCRNDCYSVRWMNDSLMIIRKDTVSFLHVFCRVVSGERERDLGIWLP